MHLPERALARLQVLQANVMTAQSILDEAAKVAVEAAGCDLSERWHLNIETGELTKEDAS
jgi:hypothetical protein